MSRGKVSLNGTHHKIIRLGLTGAILFLLLVSLFGCNNTTPTPEPVTITFVHHDGEADYYDTLVQRFNEDYPHITVRLQSAWTADADVFVDLPYTLGQRLAQGELLSLDPFIEQDESFDLADFYPGAVSVFTREGKTWAVPAGVNPMVMFYNQDLFDQYGVPYPKVEWTWDEFLNAALAIRDPDADVFGYVAPPQPFPFDVLLFIHQHGGRIFDDLQSPTHTTFDDPLTIEAVEWYAALINEHNVAPTRDQTRRLFGTGAGGIYRGVLRGRAGMWIGWFSDRGGLTWPVEWDMRWGMVPVPRDAQSVTGATVEGFFISAQTGHPDACWHWIDFLSQQVPASLMPANRSVAESAAYEGQVGQEVAAVGQLSMENAILVSPDQAEFESTLEVFFKALDDVVNGRYTPAEAMHWAQRESQR